MKAKMRSALVALVLATAVCSTAHAAPWQQWRGSGGWGMGGDYQRMYDPAKVETVSGEVVAIEKVTPIKGPRGGIHLQLKTETGTVPVHLGPSWFIERQDTRIDKGDRIEVKGARVELQGKPAIVAAEVKKGDAVLKLRDENGVPAWAGWRK